MPVGAGNDGAAGRGLAPQEHLQGLELEEVAVFGFGEGVAAQAKASATGILGSVVR